MSDLRPYQKSAIRDRVGDEAFYAGGAYPHERQSGKEQLEQVIDLLYKEKWIILSIFLVVFAGFGAYAYTSEARYGASSLVMISGVNASGSSSGSSSSDPARFAGPDMQWGRSPSTELTLLQNSVELPRSVAERLLELGHEEKTRMGAFLTTETGDTLSQEQVTRRVQSSMSFRTTGDGLIQFSAVTSSPRASQRLSNLYVQEYLALTQRVSRASLVASRNFLQSQLQTHEEELQQVEDRIQDYLSQRGALSIETEGARVSQQVAQMEGRRDQIDIELQRRRATVRALRSNLEAIQPQLAQGMASTVSQDIELLQQKIGDLKATRQEAIVQHPEWTNPEERPELRKINSQIQRLQEEVDQLSQEYVNQVVGAEGTSDSAEGSGGLQRAVGIKQQIASEQVAITGLEAELEALGQQIQTYRAELRNIPGESLEIEKLRRDRSRIEETYNYISQRLQEIRIREQGELGYASVIAQASPGRSVQPQAERTLVLGAFFGLLLGMGAALFHYKFDNRLFKPDQIEDRGYNVTIVPDMDGLLETEYGGQALIERDGKKVATSLVTLHNATSHATEAYRQLRTNVQYGLSDQPSNVVLVTSSGVGEGKSTTAANLAVAFARVGSRTLLIDADMRRPQVHSFFGLNLEPGLHQLLDGQIGFASERMEVGIQNLSVLTAGKVTGGDAGELIGGHRMQELLSSARERFDIIIVDSPPALAVSEAKIIAPKANGTLLIAQAGETKEKELDYAVRELERVGGHVLGVVLNRFSLDKAYGYKYRYRDYSAQGHYASYARG